MGEDSQAAEAATTRPFLKRSGMDPRVKPEDDEGWNVGARLGLLNIGKRG